VEKDRHFAVCRGYGLIFVAELAGGVGYVAWLALTLFHAM
jgi:hypothetical protein